MTNWKPIPAPRFAMSGPWPSVVEEADWAEPVLPMKVLELLVEPKLEYVLIQGGPVVDGPDTCPVNAMSPFR